MIFSILAFFRGYLQVRFWGRDVERYLNLCGRNDLLLWNVRRTAEGIVCCIAVEDYRESRPFLRKTGTKSAIEKRAGLPFFLHRYRKRWLFALGCFLALGVLYLSSGFVWRIEIRGNSYISDEKILQLLEEHRWFYGSRIASVDTETLEKTLRNELTDIIWVSADLTGTCLTIDIKENLRWEDEVGQSEETLSGGYDLVSTADGVVSSIVTRSGTPKVKAGDEVKNGDVLISGIVELTDPMTGEARPSYCESDGDVIVASSLTYEDTFPMTYEEKVFTGREWDVTLFGPHGGWLWKYSIWEPYERYDTLIERSQVVAGNGYFLPIDCARIRKLEYQIRRKERTEDEAKEKVKEDFSFYLQNLAQKGIQTIEKNVIISYKDGECLAQGTLKTEQAMTQKRPSPTETTVEEENDQHELQ